MEIKILRKKTIPEVEREMFDMIYKGWKQYGSVKKVFTLIRGYHYKVVIKKEA